MAVTMKGSAGTKSQKSKASSGEKKGKSPGWAMKGAAAKKALAHEEHQSEINKSQKGKPWRFRMKEKEQTSITFLDGDLDEDGVLDMLTFYEHELELNGRWGNFFICTNGPRPEDDDEPCPLCQSGHKRSLVGVLTVIDHTVSKAGDGKVYKDQKRLFVAKTGTIKQLQMLASKRKGLTGCLFDVARTDDKKARVGDVFDFTEKFDTDELTAQYPEIEDMGPYDYSEVFEYKSAEELRQMGFGSAPIGSESGFSDTDGNDYGDEL